MARKLSLSDLRSSGRRPSWAAETRQSYLKTLEQDTNALKEARAAAKSIEEAEGIVLPEAQIRDMANQIKTTGDFSIQEAPKADFSDVTASSSTTDSSPGLLDRLSTYGGATIDALQGGLQR